MNGLFVTGTGTDVGKTVVSALLLAELRNRGVDAAPMKPAQTGCVKKVTDNPNGGGLPFSVPDLDYSLAMAAMEVNDETYRNMAPYTFEPACSPHLAAEMAGGEIDLSEIVAAARTLSNAYGFLLAEGAGGVLVPLNDRETMLDLMRALRLPALLVASAGLGTINHTLLSIRALRSGGVELAGVVLATATPGEPGFIERDNPRAIERFGKVPVLGTLPYDPVLAEPAPRFGRLSSATHAAIGKIVERLAPTLGIF